MILRVLEDGVYTTADFTDRQIVGIQVEVKNNYANLAIVSEGGFSPKFKIKHWPMTRGMTAGQVYDIFYTAANCIMEMNREKFLPNTPIANQRDAIWERVFESVPFIDVEAHDVLTFNTRKVKPAK
jgi:hypothetical protein